MNPDPLTISLAVLGPLFACYGVTLVIRALIGEIVRRPGRQHAARARAARQERRRKSFKRVITWPLLGLGVLVTGVGLTGLWAALYITFVLYEMFDSTGVTVLLTAGVAAGFFALGLAAWGIRGRDTAGLPRCRRCFFDLTGLPVPTCPECGQEHPGDAHLLRRRRRPWAVALASIIALFASYLIGHTAQVSRGGLWGLVPTTPMILLWNWLPKPLVFGYAANAPGPVFAPGNVGTGLEAAVPHRTRLTARLVAMSPRDPRRMLARALFANAAQHANTPTRITQAFGMVALLEPAAPVTPGGTQAALADPLAQIVNRAIEASLRQLLDEDLRNDEAAGKALASILYSRRVAVRFADAMSDFVAANPLTERQRAVLRAAVNTPGTFAQNFSAQLLISDINAIEDGSLRASKKSELVTSLIDEAIANTGEPSPWLIAQLAMEDDGSIIAMLVARLTNTDPKVRSLIVLSLLFAEKSPLEIPALREAMVLALQPNERALDGMLAAVVCQHAFNQPVDRELLALAVETTTDPNAYNSAYAVNTFWSHGPEHDDLLLRIVDAFLLKPSAASPLDIKPMIENVLRSRTGADRTSLMHAITARIEAVPRLPSAPPPSPDSLISPMPEQVEAWQEYESLHAKKKIMAATLAAWLEEVRSSLDSAEGTEGAAPPPTDPPTTEPAPPAATEPPAPAGPAGP